jgi:RimJ/RimL family protein N-acetyltransferase
MGKLLADALPALPYVEPALPEPRRRSDGVLIRPVETADAAAVQTFERRQLGALKGIYLKSLDEVPADIAAIEAQLTGMLKRPKTLTLGAFDADGCMVAYAGLWPETFRRIAHEASCNVNALPEWWGSGIGRQMIARIEAFAREHGFLRLAAYVSANNRRGRCFAAAAGFSDEVVLRQYVVIDGKAMDRIRLVRFLPSPAEAGEGGEPEGRAG